MEADRVRDGGCNAHPVPCVLLIVRSLVIVRKEQECLHERNAI